jgi:hypothetical protein
MVVGSARSKARAFGMKSNADQMRMAAWLTIATSSGVRTAGCSHTTISDPMTVSSNIVWAGIQKRLRDMPPRVGWIRSGRLGQNGSTTRISVKP